MTADSSSNELYLINNKRGSNKSTNSDTTTNRQDFNSPITITRSINTTAKRRQGTNSNPNSEVLLSEEEEGRRGEAAEQETSSSASSSLLAINTGVEVDQEENTSSSIASEESLSSVTHNLAQSPLTSIFNHNLIYSYSSGNASFTNIASSYSSSKGSTTSTNIPLVAATVAAAAAASSPTNDRGGADSISSRESFDEQPIEQYQYFPLSAITESTSYQATTHHQFYQHQMSAADSAAAAAYAASTYAAYANPNQTANTPSTSSSATNLGYSTNHHQHHDSAVYAERFMRSAAAGLDLTSPQTSGQYSGANCSNIINAAVGSSSSSNGSASSPYDQSTAAAAAAARAAAAVSSYSDYTSYYTRHVDADFYRQGIYSAVAMAAAANSVDGATANVGFFGSRLVFRNT